MSPSIASRCSPPRPTGSARSSSSPSVAVGVGVQRIGLARVDGAVPVRVLDAVREPIAVRVRGARVRLAGIDAAVVVRVLDAVGESVAVGVGVQRVGLAGFERSVVISADATPNQIRRLLDQGARDYVTKPFSLDRLMSAVDAALDTAGAGR
jgi:hypothetical protein